MGLFRRRRAADAVSPAVSAAETATEIIDPAAAGGAFMAGGAISGPLRSWLSHSNRPPEELDPNIPRSERRAMRRARRRARRSG
jgi:hypothetical protein